MSRTCPTCGDDMEREGGRGDVNRAESVTVTWDRCPSCETIVLEDGDVRTRRDQIHATAWIEYAEATGDYSVLP